MSEGHPIKIGLLGCGMVAGYGHLPAIAEVSELQLTGVFDPNAEAAETAAARYGCNAFTDVEALMASGVEAITITSPAPAHRQNVLDGARHGLPMLCEKPLAMNEAEAREMLDTAEKAGVGLYTGFCYRFAPAAMRIKRLVAEGAIGQVRSLRLIYLWDCHGRYKQRDPALGLQERRVGRMKEGGPMVDCGTHQIDLAMWWLNSPVVAFEGHGAWLEEWDAPDHVWVHMDHASGAHTCVEMSYSYGHTAKNSPHVFDYELIGTEGLIRYGSAEQSLTVHDATGVREMEWSGPKDFVGMYRAFAQVLTTGEPGDLPTAETGLTVTNIARRATEQAMARRKGRG